MAYFPESWFCCIFGFFFIIREPIKIFPWKFNRICIFICRLRFKKKNPENIYQWGKPREIPGFFPELSFPGIKKNPLVKSAIFLNIIKEQAISYKMIPNMTKFRNFKGKQDYRDLPLAGITLFPQGKCIIRKRIKIFTWKFNCIRIFWCRLRYEKKTPENIFLN